VENIRHAILMFWNFSEIASCKGEAAVADLLPLQFCA